MPQVHRLFFTVWQKPFKMLWLLLLLIIMRSMLIILSRRLLTAPAHGHDREKRPRYPYPGPAPDPDPETEPNRTVPYRTDLRLHHGVYNNYQGIHAQDQARKRLKKGYKTLLNFLVSQAEVFKWPWSVTDILFWRRSRSRRWS